MTLEQLRIFVAVAERQHVTQAAHALNLAQSAASHAIAALESEHDTKLFDRVGRRIVLTEAGRVFLGEAQAVLVRAAAAERMLLELAGLKRGTLSVQASQTIAGYWLPRYLAAYRRAYPDIAIDLAIGNTKEVAEAVESGAAELGFVEGAVANDKFISTPVARDQLIIVVGREHPWVGRKRLTHNDLKSAAWVLREPGSGTRSVFEKALRTHGINLSALRIELEIPSNEGVRAAVEAGLGATALSASVAAAGIEAGLLHAVDFALPDRAFHVLCHRERYRSRAAQALLDLVLKPRPKERTRSGSMRQRMQPR
jgi:DNA-binding transcriptional LysR family regulator